MHARVWHMRILPSKLEEFTSAVHSLIPAARKQAGFRGVVVLRTDEGTKPEAMLIAVWDSLADLRASENNLFVVQAIARFGGCCEGFPSIHEHEVLVSEFAA